MLVLFDAEGRVVLMNSLNRNRIDEALDPDQLRQIQGQSLLRYTPDTTWLPQVRSGRFAYLDWHYSPLIHQLYHYVDEDVARQYSVGFASPIFDTRGVVVGGVLALMNWEYVQEILDKVEEDLEERALASGYAFLFGRDRNTILGHKYRQNRSYHLDAVRELGGPVNNYGTRLIEDHKLVDLQRAVVKGETHFQYEYPPGTNKISGWAPIDHEFFQWVSGVGINNEDIFAPVQDLKEVLIGTASLSAFLVVVLTYLVARGITTPLKKLTVGASVIASGNLSERVQVSSGDEMGELARKFQRDGEFAARPWPGAA